jgi:hypothetical protein
LPTQRGEGGGSVFAADGAPAGIVWGSDGRTRPIIGGGAIRRLLEGPDEDCRAVEARQAANGWPKA